MSTSDCNVPPVNSPYDGIVALYHRMRSAQGEEFDLLWTQYKAKADADPELVARALTEGALPIG